jgi:hypothetical protein
MQEEARQWIEKGLLILLLQKELTEFEQDKGAFQAL